MFIISNPDLPTTNLSQPSGAAVFSLTQAEPNNFASLTQIASVSGRTIPINSTSATYSGSTISIDVSTLNLTNIEAIEIAGIRYTRSYNPNDIAARQFFWNIYSQRITVVTATDKSFSSTLASPPPNAVILIYATGDISTDYVAPPYPSIFNFVPMEGTFSWAISFEGQPTGSFEFTTYAALRQSVIGVLTPGTEFIAFDVGFRINTISITELPAILDPQRLIKVTVSLGGKQENYLDRIVTLLPPGQTADDSLDCFGKISLAQFQASEYPAFTTVQALASRSGSAFNGMSMRVDIPLGTPRNEGTTFISKAIERVRQYGCFLRYSDYSAVKAIDLDAVPTHSFTEFDLRSPVTTSISGKKVQTAFGSSPFSPPQISNILPTQPLKPPEIAIASENQSLYPYVHTYEPRYSLSGRFETDLERYETEKTQFTAADDTMPQWKQRERVIQQIPDGDLHPEIPPANTGSLKDLSNNFSSSGLTKTYKLVTTIDGLPQSEYLQRWGFAFLSQDMLGGDRKSFVGATNAWQMVEEKTTTYLYDRRTGYQLGSDTVGWELTRFEEETGIETIRLGISGKEADLARRKLYEYFKLAYRKQDRVFLEALRSYYNDIGSPPVEVYPVCLPSGQLEYRPVFDPTYVEPFFASVITTHENSFKAVPNPESTTKNPLPPKTTGKESFFRKNITVLASKSTTTSAEASFNASSDRKAEDSYNEYNSQFSSQDAGFSNSAENTNFTRQPNRPPVATILPPLTERVEPENLAGKPDEPILYNYYAETNYNPFYREARIQGSSSSLSTLNGGSLNYPAAKTLKEAQTAAETEITIANIRDCLQENLTIPFSPHIKEGNRLNYTCNGTHRKRRVLNISHEVKFNGLLGGIPIVTSPGSKVTLGLERKTSVTFTKEKEPPTPTADDGYNLKVFFVPDTYPMGEIQDPDMPTRRNFNV